MNPSNQKDINWNQLIIKFLEGKATLSEEMDLHRWIDATAENKMLFTQYRNLWLAATAKTSPDAFITADAWQKVKGYIGKESPEREAGISFFSGSGIKQFLRIAAIVIFIFILGALSSRWYYLKSGNMTTGECIVSTPLGSRTYLVLPDKSQVWLNAGSTLIYPYLFDKKTRKVTLEGEAFFKVNSDKSRPFVVSTSYMDVKALGTTFNVKAYPEDTFALATLIEGSIKVDGKLIARNFSYTLEPKQSITIPVIAVDETAPKKNDNPSEHLTGYNREVSPKIEVKSTALTEAIVSWKDQLWTIQGEPLNSLAVLLERRYNTKIHLSSELLQQYKFTGTIKNETLEQVLEYLRYTTPLKYIIGKGEVWWDIDPELVNQYSKILNKK